MADSWDLRNLGPNAFEHMVNALALRVLGAGATDFRPLSDGGRDGYFEGVAPYPAEGPTHARWNGIWYVQSKFNSGEDENGQRWLVGQVKTELEAFSDPKTKRRWPDNWIVATNVEPSAVPETGTLDRLRKIVSDARPGMNFHVWGGRHILNLLTVHRDIAVRYIHFLTPGDVLTTLHNALTETSKTGGTHVLPRPTQPDADRLHPENRHLPISQGAGTIASSLLNAPARASKEGTTYDVFFSYNTPDHLAVESIASHLQQQGLRVLLDRWSLPKGIPWLEYLEGVFTGCNSVAVFVGQEGLGRWQQREKDLALDRQTKERTFPVIPVLLPKADPPLGFLSLNTWVDLRHGIHDESGLAALISAVRGLPAGFSTQPAASISPYRGLRYFREEDAAFFFGRDELIKQLVDAVHEKPLVTVVGASGSGKSSAVRAGLIPRLRAAHDECVWEIVTMVPGDRPLHALVGAFMPLLEPQMGDTDRAIQTGKLAEVIGVTTPLRDLVAIALRKQPGTDRLLLIIDQAEELYTGSKPDGIRQKFLDEILDACTEASLTVTLTLRADFMNEVLNSSQLAQRVRDGVVYVMPMTGAELRQVIELPALKTGLSFEPGLIQRMLEKVEGRPGDLPLLEFVLAQLWERRSPGGKLTHDAYDAIGEVDGAIATHADKVLRAFSAGQRTEALRVLLQLVRPAIPAAVDGDGRKTRHVRRRSSFDELGTRARPVIVKLADAHLIVTSRDEATGREVVDLVHEALIERWKTLGDRIDADRAFLVWREQLRTLQSFAAGAEAVPLTGHLLSESQRWLRERPEDLSADQRQSIESAARSRRTEITLRVSALAILLAAFAVLGYLTFQLIRPPNQFLKATTSSTAIPTTTSPRTTRTDDEVLVPEKDLPPLQSVAIPKTPVIIPVVVHVIYKNASENIGDEQIRSQIAALNRDFRARNEDIRQVPEPFRPFVGDAKIEFVLATVDPHGQPTSGITRTATTIGVFGPAADPETQPHEVAHAWPADRYLNIWTCNSDWVREYAFMPGASADRDGIVVQYEYFGTTSEAKSHLGFKSGRSATHAVGHWLGLYHIWGVRDDCSDDDLVDDTPRQAGPHPDKVSFPQRSCDGNPAGSMFMNYMDITNDDTRVMFTKGQVRRMHQFLQSKRRGFLAPAATTTSGR